MCLEAYAYLRTMPECMYLDLKLENIRIIKSNNRIRAKVYSQLITKMDTIYQYKNTLSDLAHLFSGLYINHIKNGSGNVYRNGAIV